MSNLYCFLLAFKVELQSILCITNNFIDSSSSDFSHSSCIKFIFLGGAPSGGRSIGPGRGDREGPSRGGPDRGEPFRGEPARGAERIVLPGERNVIIWTMLILHCIARNIILEC